MNLLLPPLLVGLLAGCTAQVTHPTKSVPEMQVDIDRCTNAAQHKYWMDPVAALLNAYDCLEEMGYQRGDKRVSERVEKAVAAIPPPPEGGATPCRVPCRRQP